MLVWVKAITSPVEHLYRHRTEATGVCEAQIRCRYVHEGKRRGSGVHRALCRRLVFGGDEVDHHRGSEAGVGKRVQNEGSGGGEISDGH